MSSAFNMPGSYGFLSNSMPAIKNVSKGDWFLYIVLALIVFLVIMMLSQIKIDLSWLDPRPKRKIVTDKGDLFWKPSAQFTNLTVPVESYTKSFNDAEYSMLIECVLYNTRNYGKVDGPYRQLVHRGSDELAQATVGGLLKTGCAASNNYGKLPPFGLPKRMNPGIFLDPNVNDILVFVDTYLDADNYRESVRIQDIPLDKPFRLGVVLKGRVLEVYLNCRLEVTKVLTGDPKIVEHEWYGLAGPASAQAQIQNLYIWNMGLAADEMNPLCPGPPVFTKERPICEGADTVIPTPKPSENVENTIDLGFGAQINTCPN